MVYNKCYVNHVASSDQNVFRRICEAIPIKCFVSHRPPSREGGSVGRAKKKRERSLEGVWVPGKVGLLSTKAWLRGPFVRNQMV